MLKIGMKAPSFTLFEKSGTPVSLSNFIKKRIEKIMPKVKPDTNAAKLSAAL